MELRGSIGILTGASRGLGVLMAERLASKGVNLALAARSATELQETVGRVQSRGVRAIGVPTDVTKREDLERLVDRTTNELGPPDLLVNNAGIEFLGGFQSIPLDTIEAVLTTNVIGLISLTRLVVPQMIERGRGHVVNISSMAGKAASPYYTIYSASKHAVVGFSWSLRAELKPKGVGVSVVCPGYVDETGMFSYRNAGKPPRSVGTVRPEDVAAAVVKVVEQDKAEAVVAGGLFKIADVAHAVSPDFAMAMGRRSGAYGYIEKMAARADREKSE
jgi:short-subunit dehydrogenase